MLSGAAKHALSRTGSAPLHSWNTQEEFILGDRLTQGSYGSVYLARHRRTEREFVAKVLVDAGR
jgi:serine/threonine protein kinase